MTDVQEIPQAFVRYGRKVSPKQYETAEASISIPVTVPDGGVTDEFLANVDKALNEAQLRVLAALDLNVAVTSDGTVTESVQNAEAAVANAFPGAQRAVNPAPAGDVPECPKGCGKGMWDNRNDKRNRRSPDFKCKNKECGHPIWLDSKF